MRSLLSSIPGVSIGAAEHHARYGLVAGEEYQLEQLVRREPEEDDYWEQESVRWLDEEHAFGYEQEERPGVGSRAKTRDAASIVGVDDSEEDNEPSLGEKHNLEETRTGRESEQDERDGLYWTWRSYRLHYQRYIMKFG